MKKKHILRKTIFVSVLTVGLMAGALALAQTAPVSGSAGASGSGASAVSSGPGMQVQGNSSAQNLPGNRVVTRASGFAPGMGGNMMSRSYAGFNHYGSGLSVWFAIMSSITMILVWLIMVEIIMLLFKKLMNHEKKQ